MCKFLNIIIKLYLYFRSHINSDVKICTHYLELLCQYEPNAVMDFVKTNDSLHITRAIAVRIIIGFFFL